MIKNNLPVDFDLNYSIWSRKEITELTENKFGLDIAIRIMGDYLKRWNFSYQKPTKRAYQRDERKVAKFLRDKIPLRFGHKPKREKEKLSILVMKPVCIQSS
jgi:transposase